MKSEKFSLDNLTNLVINVKKLSIFNKKIKKLS